MMRTATMMMLAALAVAVLATPAQADVPGQIDNLQDQVEEDVGPVPPHAGCNQYVPFELRLCTGSGDCAYVAWHATFGQGVIFAGC